MSNRLCPHCGEGAGGSTPVAIEAGVVEDTDEAWVVCLYCFGGFVSWDHGRLRKLTAAEAVEAAHDPGILRAVGRLFNSRALGRPMT